MHGELKLQAELVRHSVQTRRPVFLVAPCMALMDALMFALAFCAALLVVNWQGTIVDTLPQLQAPRFEATSIYLGIVAVALATFWVHGHYTRRRPFWDELRVIWRVLALAAVFNFAMYFLARLNPSRSSIVSAWLFLLVLLPLGRIAIRMLLQRVKLWRRPVLVVGHGQNALDAHAALTREKQMGMEVIGFATLDPAGPSFVRIGKTLVPVYPLGEEPERVFAELGCHSAVVALDWLDPALASPLIARLNRFKLDVSVVPSIRGLPVYGLETQHFLAQEMLFLRIQNNLARPSAKFVKRVFDVIAASILLVLLLPLLLYVGWCIWREDGGPVVLKQMRMGEEGKEFAFLKFRSMTRDADATLMGWKTANPALYAEYVRNNFKLVHDPRVLLVGSWIRRTSIDELPQLINVIRGEMSLVGPRPLLARELPDYSEDAFAMYMLVKPGITGLWQVSGRSGTSFLDRAALDARYVRNWSLWQDFVILMKTLHVVCHRDGAY